MNTATATIDPAELAHQLASANRTIINRAEFARLIRKHRCVTAAVFVSSHSREDVVPRTGGECFIAEMSAAYALKQLAQGAFDTHVWELKDGTLTISWRVAPAWLQISRRREIILANLAKYESWISSPGAAADPEYAARIRGYIADAKAGLAELEVRSESLATAA